jgi:predicted DNA repair protein MutK
MKGSFKNKAILVPLALVISAFLPWAVVPLLMIGGAFLCFEGFEKLTHKWLHKEEDQKHHKELSQALLNPAIDLAALEKEQIKGAVRTDFILSAEIIVISMGAASGMPFLTQFLTLAGIALVMTVGVYGLVAGIVKLDDLGLYFKGTAEKPGPAAAVGRGILLFAPFLMKSLSVLGTAAMFLVGGGIIAHGIPGLEAVVHSIAAPAWIAWALPTVLGGVVGLISGAVILGLVTLFSKVRTSIAKQ